MAIRISALAATVVVLVAIDVAAARTEQSSRAVDRTFRCKPEAVPGGDRHLALSAVPRGGGERYGSEDEPSPGFVGAATGGRDPYTELVSIRARRWHRLPGRVSPQGVYVGIRRCVPSRANVALSPAGLPGPPVRWAEQPECQFKARELLIRVRATLAAPAPWWRHTGHYAGARANVLESKVVIRGARGKPIAYMELGRDGKTKLWRSAVCA
jgi:hypothetical protein